ncbi:MAG: choice-of-anchor J domain-containing protein, partial [Myxococcota bacterium]
DPVTGVLSGTPTAGDAGMVTVNLRYEEPGMPQNFDTATVSLEVVTGLFFDTFESGCSTWTLTGDWACGAPTSGPGSALGGTNVIATNLAGDYAVGVNAGTATATSGTIDLTAATAPLLSFSVWQQWEGSTSDGFYVEVSTDGGTTFTLLTAVTPAYNLSLSGQPAWGDLTLVGWTAYTADLSAFVGQSISLRFQYESDGSDQFPGSYIDDVLVSD